MSAPLRQRGVALLAVLLLAAVMSVLAIAVLDDVRFGVRGADNAQSVAQAQWHALGAETLAALQVERLAARDPQRTTAEGGWNGRAFVFPLEDGAISARLSDGNACFNLNGVVEGAGELLVRHEPGVRQYRSLLRALGIPEHEAARLADALADWIDSDAEPAPDGAEDDAYLRSGDGYRTGATLLADATELRAIRGYTPALYARLRPHVCALPVAGPTPINLNTLEARHAPLLVMLSEGRLDVDRARALIAARPRGGWRSLSEFWTHPLLAGAALPDAVLQQLALRTRYFRLHAQVQYGPAQVELSALLEHDGVRVRRLSRHWSTEE